MEGKEGFVGQEKGREEKRRWAQARQTAEDVFSAARALWRSSATLSKLRVLWELPALRPQTTRTIPQQESATSKQAPAPQALAARSPVTESFDNGVPRWTPNHDP